jgi:hypothetical protein
MDIMGHDQPLLCCIFVVEKCDRNSVNSSQKATRINRQDCGSTRHPSRLYYSTIDCEKEGLGYAYFLPFVGVGKMVTQLLRTSQGDSLQI